MLHITCYYAAVRAAIERIIPWEILFPTVSSITTDGTTNRGKEGGLWALMRSDRHHCRLC